MTYITPDQVLDLWRSLLPGCPGSVAALHSRSRRGAQWGPPCHLVKDGQPPPGRRLYVESEVVDWLIDQQPPAVRPWNRLAVAAKSANVAITITGDDADLTYGCIVRVGDAEGSRRGAPDLHLALQGALWDCLVSGATSALSSP